MFFQSFLGQYSDNPRAISEAIHELDPTIELVWYLKNETEAPNYIKRVNGIKASIYQVQADAWVLNNPNSPSLGNYKGEGTFYVQTWHGDRGFKRIGWSKKEELGDKFDGAYFDSQGIDLFTAGSSFAVKMFRDGFLYKGETQIVGTPRNDKLVKLNEYKDYIKKVKQKLNINENVKVLLFAPTFRDFQNTKQDVLVDIPRCLEILSSSGEEWICLLRSHSHSKGFDTTYDKKMIDVTDFGDMADLLMVADCLITDYSSCSCDFILTGKPCVLALFDEEEYKRPLWVTPKEAGFLVAKDQIELDRILLKLYDYNHKEIDDRILNYYETKETGNASMITAKRIIDWLYRIPNN